MKSKTLNWTNPTASQAVRGLGADGNSAQKNEQTAPGGVSIGYQKTFNGYVTNHTWE